VFSPRSVSNQELLCGVRLIERQELTDLTFSSVFSVMAITMGGILFPPLQSFISNTVASKQSAPEVSASFIYLLAAVSMAVPALCIAGKLTFTTHCFDLIICSFMVVELCVGLFMPVAGTLRSKYVPDALQGGILNIFRLPLNTIVVLGTYATDVMDPEIVFGLVSSCFFLASLLQASMIPSGKAVAARKKTD
jgi:hypothetical protein